MLDEKSELKHRLAGIGANIIKNHKRLTPDHLMDNPKLVIALAEVTRQTLGDPMFTANQIEWTPLGLVQHINYIIEEM